MCKLGILHTTICKKLSLTKGYIQNSQKYGTSLEMFNKKQPKMIIIPIDNVVSKPLYSSYDNSLTVGEFSKKQNYFKTIQKYLDGKCK